MFHNEYDALSRNLTVSEIFPHILDFSYLHINLTLQVISSEFHHNTDITVTDFQSNPIYLKQPNTKYYKKYIEQVNLAKLA